MESKAKLFGHPIHQMLIVFPLGLLATAVAFDGLSYLTNNSRWTEMAFYMIGAGVVTGLIAAVFGWVDYFSIPVGTRAKAIGLRHGLGNVLVLLLFGMSWWVRSFNTANPSKMAYMLSLVGALLALVTGWLGGELVNRLGIGVSDHAGPNAPSSLHAGRG